jgi:hypothetical protein
MRGCVWHRGSALLSRLVTYIRSRLYGAVFVSVGYLEPKLIWDIGKDPMLRV